MHRPNLTTRRMQDDAVIVRKGAEYVGDDFLVERKGLAELRNGRRRAVVDEVATDRCVKGTMSQGHAHESGEWDIDPP